MSHHLRFLRRWGSLDAYDAGNTLEIDTAGPSVSRLQIQPKAPIKNDPSQPVTLTVTLGLNEASKSGSAPDFACTLSEAGRTPAVLAAGTGSRPEICGSDEVCLDYSFRATARVDLRPIPLCSFERRFGKP